MDDSKTVLSHLGGSFSKLLAYALLDLYPSAELRYEWAENDHFAYEISFKEKLTSVELSLVEEHMARTAGSLLESHVMEMIPSNASELFKAHGQKERAQKVLQTKSSTVLVLKINHFYDLLRFDFELKSLTLPFKLLSYQINEEKNTLFIQGVAAHSKDQLKKAVKNHQQAKKTSFEKLNQNQSLYHRGLFLPPLASQMSKLQQMLEAHFEQNDFLKIKAPPQLCDLKTFLEERNLYQGKYFLWSQNANVCSSLHFPIAFQIKNHTFDRWISFVSEKDIEAECISCLNFYKEIIKILGFSYRLVANVNFGRSFDGKILRALSSFEPTVVNKKAKNLEFVFELQDMFGRPLIKPSIKVLPTLVEGEKGYSLEGTFCHSLELLAIQLLELANERATKRLALKD